MDENIDSQSEDNEEMEVVGPTIWTYQRTIKLNLILNQMTLDGNNNVTKYDDKLDLEEEKSTLELYIIINFI